MKYRVAGVVLLLVATAHAEPGERTSDLTFGAGRMFDTSSDTSPVGPNRTGVVHDKQWGVGAGASVGWMATDHVAVTGQVALAIPGMLLFAGPSVKAWLGNTGIWLSGAVGGGYDATCLGRSKSCGLDQCRCDDPGTIGLDGRIGWSWSHSSTQRGTVAVELLELGAPGHGADALTAQLGWEWR